MNSDLNLLEQIQSIEAPPFLLTRINQRIELKRARSLTPRFLKTMSVSFALVLALNVFVLYKTSSEKNQTKSLLQTMNLSPDNSFYNE